MNFSSSNLDISYKSIKSGVNLNNISQDVKIDVSKKFNSALE